MKNKFFNPPRPRLFGHRGCPVLYPENTLLSFAMALQTGVSYLELDIWVSQDQKIVIHHDRSLKRVFGIDQKIPEMTLEEIKQAQASFQVNQLECKRFLKEQPSALSVPTLEEVLRSFPDAFLNLEIKPKDFPVQVLMDTLLAEDSWADRVLLASRHDKVLHKIRSICKAIPTSLGYEEIKEFYQWLDRGCYESYIPPGDALQVPRYFGKHNLISKQAIQAAKSVGLEMHIWTINDPKEAKDLLSQGVDGIMSDDPKMVCSLCNQK